MTNKSELRSKFIRASLPKMCWENNYSIAARKLEAELELVYALNDDKSVATLYGPTEVSYPASLSLCRAVLIGGKNAARVSYEDIVEAESSGFSDGSMEAASLSLDKGGRFHLDYLFIHDYQQNPSGAIANFLSRLIDSGTRLVLYCPFYDAELSKESKVFFENYYVAKSIKIGVSK